MRTFGGNRGYVGYSMSKRAAYAKEEGRYPMSEFKRVYQLSKNTFEKLIELNYISSSEWHHTSKFGNMTSFYHWIDEEAMNKTLSMSKDEKRTLDNLCKGIQNKKSFLKVIPEADESTMTIEERCELWSKRGEAREYNNHIMVEKLDEFFGL
jgi:hypothetical protein